VRVIGIYSPTYPAPDYEEDHGVEVWRLREGTYRGGWVLARYKLYQTIARWSRAHDIDLVEVPDYQGWAAGWPKLSVPIVLRAHGAHTYFAKELGMRTEPLLFCLERLCFRRADAWVAVSHYAGKMTSQAFASHSEPHAVIYNSVNVLEPIVEFSDRCSNRVIYTGTLVAKKGIISLIHAWPMVQSRCSAAELHIYGRDVGTADGEPMQNYLLRQLPSQFHDSVYFHGHVNRENIIQSLSTARVAVFPSYAEAFALAPMEAMSCGCPTIYTTLSSGPELIRDQLDGLLIDPVAPGQIADAISTILLDSAVARRLSEAGRARILSSFTVAKLLPVNEAFFADVIRSFSLNRGIEGLA